LTQTAPAPAAMSVGSWRTLKRFTTFFVSGSMRDKVLSSSPRTQTAPSPTARLLGGVSVRVNDASCVPPPSIAATPFLCGAGSSSSPPPSVAMAAPATAMSNRTPPTSRSAWASRLRSRALMCAGARGAVTPSAPAAASISSLQLP
jgi:hypothetical protein